MKISILILAIFGGTSAFHDHEVHVDRKYIEEEAHRLAWLGEDQFEQILDGHIQAMRNMMNQWKEDSSKIDSPRYKENMKKWNEKTYPTFKEYYDRAMITQHVCMDIYGEDACGFPDEEMSAFDDRQKDPAYKEEFLREVHFAVLNEVQVVKRRRADL